MSIFVVVQWRKQDKATVGLGLSQSMVDVQAVLEPDDIPPAMAITAFMESIGGSVAISVAQSVFRSQLVKNYGSGSSPG